MGSFQKTWWIFLLLIVGAVMFFLSLRSARPQADQGVVLGDILHPKTDPVPPMAIVTSPENGHETGFTIQVYSFQDKNRAEVALDALKSNGYPQAFMIMSDLGEKGVWWRVRVGGIADDVAAHQMLDNIRKTYNSGFILKPQN